MVMGEVDCVQLGVGWRGGAGHRLPAEDGSDAWGSGSKTHCC